MATELTPSAPSALPYVSWSSSSMAVIPAADWPHVFGSMQALKGHVQEYPGCQKLEAFVEPEGADYRVHCYTVWDTPEQLEVFLTTDDLPTLRAISDRNLKDGYRNH